jgi:small glutamine-rich tetratricopeptide repeat-containing protein alpha
LKLRAAAHSKLSNHESALDDCKTAISYDPNYSKAYGRMGLAYASLNDHHRARDCYKKAVELDPQNESYRNNLRIAEEKVAEVSHDFTFNKMIENLFILIAIVSIRRTIRWNAI